MHEPCLDGEFRSWLRWEQQIYEIGSGAWLRRNSVNVGDLSARQLLRLAPNRFNRVKQWLAVHSEQIEVFYVPSYSPELNPDERLNASLKHDIATKVPMRTKAKLHSAAALHMDKLTNTPERVKAFFKDPRVACAA